MQITTKIPKPARDFGKKFCYQQKKSISRIYTNSTCSNMSHCSNAIENPLLIAFPIFCDATNTATNCYKHVATALFAEFFHQRIGRALKLVRSKNPSDTSRAGGGRSG